ncbi:MAG: protein-(glutamine-N5) methyltransferase, release factor-specific [SAR202 cluster bacterium Io17-Chloro-G2]|nr:MAG: protein-(glutamine-N5) methyltransferase, release factor-specific [SAR202 cluster bacterium Io17-Chloro-G2]
MPNLRETLQQTHHSLETLNIPDARLEAEVVVMNVLRMPRHEIFAQQEREITPQQENDISAILDRRRQREPLAYIFGYKEFYGINLAVTPDVLIPRPETESMVEHALFMALMGMETPQLVVADVGTGSGAIAINLAIHLPAAHIYAIDNSEPALRVAAYNVQSHNVADRITLCYGDLLEAMPEMSDPPGPPPLLDLIVANLPYIPSQRIPTLQPEVQKEPKAALDGGEDGMEVITRLFSQAGNHLKETGVILLELDPEQVPAAQALAEKHFPEAETAVEQDLAHLDRFFIVNRGPGEE